MPFPIVLGIPKETEQQTLVMLRRGIVALLVEEMGTPANWVRPFFPVDMLDEPELEADGANTIYVRLDTAMLADKDDPDAVAKNLTHALAKFIWQFFGAKYEVECFIGELNPQWKCLIAAASELDGI